MFSKKGKRKIVVDNGIFYWCVTSKSEIEPIILSVFSESEYLFSNYYQYGDVVRTPMALDYKGETLQGYSLTFENITEITPSFVQGLILEYQQGVR